MITTRSYGYVSGDQGPICWKLGSSVGTKVRYVGNQFRWWGRRVDSLETGFVSGDQGPIRWKPVSLVGSLETAFVGGDKEPTRWKSISLVDTNIDFYIEIYIYISI